MNSAFRLSAWPAGLIAIVLISCSKPDQPARAGAGEAARPVRVAVAEVQPMERTVATTGSLAAQDQATLSIKVPGRLHSLAVDLGSVVKKGDILAQVDPQDYDLRLRQSVAALAQARATLGLPLEGGDDAVEVEKTSVVKQANAVLNEATQNRERVLSLSKTGISPQSEVDAVEAAYVVAFNRYEAALEEARTRQATLAQRRAEVDIAKKQLSDTALRAPFDGAIQARLAGLGEFLQTGTPVFTLVRTDPLRLRLEVPERDAIGLRVGQAIRLRTEGGTNVVTGRIARVSPAITEQNRMLMLEADIPNDGSLRPGLFVRGEIVTNDREEGLAVPTNVLINFAGIEKVIAIHDDKALEKTVTTGRRGAGWVEVTSGLQAGDRVVLDPGNIQTGQAVSIAHPPSLQTSKAPETSGP